MKLSVQLYSLRDAGDLDTQLAMARAAGFKWVESVASHGLPPEEFADKVAAHGLRVSSMHVSMAMAEHDLQGVIDTCHATDCRLAIMPWLPTMTTAVRSRLCSWRKLPGQWCVRNSFITSAEMAIFAPFSQKLLRIFCVTTSKSVRWHSDGRRTTKPLSR